MAARVHPTDMPSRQSDLVLESVIDGVNDHTTRQVSAKDECKGPVTDDDYSSLHADIALRNACREGDVDKLRESYRRGGSIHVNDRSIAHLLKSLKEHDDGDQTNLNAFIKHRKLSEFKGRRVRRVPGFDGTYPIHLAAGGGHALVLTELTELYRSQDPTRILDHLNTPTFTGATPLMRAVSHGQVECVKVLLKAGLSAAGLSKDDEKETPLERRQSSTVELSHKLTAGAGGLLFTNCIGNNVYHIACYAGNIEVLRVLLEHSPKFVVREACSAANRAGLYPFQYAKKKALRTLLLSYDPDANSYRTRKNSIDR